MQTDALKTASPRIHSIDEIRGLAVFCMVFYHAFFVTGSFFGISQASTLLDFFTPVQPFFAAVFIFISGISSRLSSNNLARGLKLLIISALLTFVTAVICPLINLDGMQIYFGILHFLSIAMLVFSLLKTHLDKVSPHWGILICTVLYAFTSGISDKVLSFGKLIVINLPDFLYNYNFLFPLGIYSDSFFSADYFSVFPHIFLFLAGTFTGVYAVKGNFPRALYKRRVPFLSFLGRHSLIIYIVHQPIIFGIMYLIKLF